MRSGGSKLFVVPEENVEIESEGVKILGAFERTGVGDAGSVIEVRSGVGCGQKPVFKPKEKRLLTGFVRIGDGDGGKPLRTALDCAGIDVGWTSGLGAINRLNGRLERGLDLLETMLRGGVDRTGDGEGGSHENGTRQIFSRSSRDFGPGAEGVRRCDGGAFIGNGTQKCRVGCLVPLHLRDTFLLGYLVNLCSAQKYGQAST